MENWLTSSSNRYLLFSGLLGLILIGAGIFYYNGVGLPRTKVEVLEDAKNSLDDGKLITVEIAGQVIAPGVYKLSFDGRVDDLLVKSGGFRADADRGWVDKYLNRAARLSDGQKIYIPKIGEQTMGVSAKNSGEYQSGSVPNSSDSNTKIDLNTASLTQLDSLPGIGQVYGQSIIDHRPYSKVEELLSKGVLKASVYEKVKNLVVVY